MPAEVAGCFTGQPNQYGRDVVSSGPYMIEGSDKVDVARARRSSPAQPGFDGDVEPGPRPQPELRPRRRTPRRRARTSPTSSTFTVDSNADDIFNRVAAGDLDDEIAGAAAEGAAPVPDDSSLKQYFHINRRPHLVPDDEPDAAAVRRHPRPAGDELDHRQGGAAQGLGRPDGRRDRERTSSRTRSSTTSSRATTPYGTPGDTGSSRKAEGRDEGLEVRHEPRRHVRRASACQNVLLVADARAVDHGMLPVIEAGRGEDRHHLQGALGATAPTRRSRRRRRTSRSRRARAGARTTPTRSTFFDPLFDGRNIIPRRATRTTRSSASRRRSRRRWAQADRSQGSRPSIRRSTTATS